MGLIDEGAAERCQILICDFFRIKSKEPRRSIITDQALIPFFTLSEQIGYPRNQLFGMIEILLENIMRTQMRIL